MSIKYIGMCIVVASLLSLTSPKETTQFTTNELLKAITTTTTTTTTLAQKTTPLPMALSTTTTTTTTTKATKPTTSARGMITTETTQGWTNSSYEVSPLITAAKGRSLSTRPTQLLLHGPHLLPHESIFQVVHTCLTVLALTCNCVSLCVIYGIVPKLTPPLRLLTSLAFCDMLAPWAIMTLYFSRSACQDEIHTSVLLAAHNAAALTLISLALIHNIATFRPLHYERIASSRNIWTVVGVLWVMSTLLAHVHFFVSIFDRTNTSDLSGSVTVTSRNTTVSPSFTSPPFSSSLIGSTYCERIESSTSIALIISGFLCVLAVLSGGVVYARILLHLRPVDAFLTPQTTTSSEEGTRVRGGMTLSRHSTRGVLTGVVLLAGYALTWLPYLVVKYVSVEVSMSDYTTMQISSSDVLEGRLTDDAAVQVAVGVCQALLIVGCIVNPVVCGCRMTCLQLGYSQLLVRCRVGCIRAWIGCRRRIRRYRGDDDEVPTTPLNQISESLCY